MYRLAAGLLALCLCCMSPAAGHAAPLDWIVQALANPTAPQKKITKRRADPKWAALLGVAIEDLSYAKALADAAGTPAGEARAACWAAWILVSGQAHSAMAGIRGFAQSASASQFEQALQVAEALRPYAPFQRACTPVAQAAGMGLATFINAVSAGKSPRR